jgi:hypothetical protein
VFDKAAALVRSPAYADQLASILSSVAASGKTAKAQSLRSRSLTSRPAPTAKILEDLREVDPQKYEAISKFLSAFVTGEVLPTIREVKAFAEACGLQNFTATSREKAIAPLVRALVGLPTEEIVRRAGRLPKSGRRDRELEGWAGIILKKDQT